uniref:TUG ubiquitin-like domain-containing protein n=1 Tax=Nomascus leucogenys TaxID=61853 RepID=A0A2I3H3Y7_NOMLE
VRIALQLDDGSRLQNSFCSGQTLWELLSHFAQTRECLQHPSGATPVCVYTRDEVGGPLLLTQSPLTLSPLSNWKICSPAAVSRAVAGDSGS